MKEKTKKIMAGLGIGLALMGGAFTMTGCTNMLTQDQINKILTVVDNSDKFMEESLDLLEENNKILDSSQALKFYEYSINRIILNKDNIWDNLKVSFNYNNDESEYYEQHYFKLNSGVNVTYSKNSQNITSYHDSTIKAGEVTNEAGLTEFISSFDYYASTSFSGTVGGITASFDVKDVAYSNVDEDGNYEISLVTNNLFDIEDNKAIVDVVISDDGYLKTINYYVLEKNYSPNALVNNLQTLFVGINYEYGVLTETEVQSNIDTFNQNN